MTALMPDAPSHAAGSATVSRATDGSAWTLANAALRLDFRPRERRFMLARPDCPAELTLDFAPFVLAVEGEPLDLAAFRCEVATPVEGDDGLVGIDVTLACDRPALRLRLELRLSAEGEPLRWRATAGAAGGSRVDLTALRSLRLRLPYGGWRWRTMAGGRRNMFAGFPPNAFGLRETALGPGVSAQTSSGIEGRSSAEDVPWFALEQPDGSGFYAGLEWSGLWLADLRDQGDGSELVAGMSGVRCTLTGGETLAGPWMFLGGYAGGLEGAGQALTRRLLRRHCPPTPAGFPWTQYNSWYAFGADFDAAQLRREAELAAELGLEVFVIDDGWFRGRKRRERGAGWGDWIADPERFPGGLEQFSRYVHGLGLRFGLWVEPEQIDRRGTLATAHPDWFLRLDGREVRSRSGEEMSAHLCLGHPEVVAWLQQDLARMVRQYDVDWIKWDYNIGYGAGCDARGHGHGAGDGSYAYVRGLYALLGHLNEQFPQLMIEGCASSGNRIDFGLLRHIHTEWLSDVSQGPANVRFHVAVAGYALPSRYLNTFVVNARLGGFPFGRPAAAPSGPPPRLTETEFRSRMGGAFGISARLAEWDAETLALAKASVAEYKALRPLLTGERALLLPQARDLRHWEAWQFIGADRRTAVILAFNNESPDADCPLRPRGLDPVAQYQLRGEGVPMERRRGEHLQRDGLRLRLERPGASALVWLSEL